MKYRGFLAAICLALAISTGLAIKCHKGTLGSTKHSDNKNKTSVADCGNNIKVCSKKVETFYRGAPGILITMDCGDAGELDNKCETTKVEENVSIEVCTCTEDECNNANRCTMGIISLIFTLLPIVYTAKMQ